MVALIILSFLLGIFAGMAVPIAVALTHVNKGE